MLLPNADFGGPMLYRERMRNGWALTRDWERPRKCYLRQALSRIVPLYYEPVYNYFDCMFIVLLLVVGVVMRAVNEKAEGSFLSKFMSETVGRSADEIGRALEADDEVIFALI